MYIAVVTGRRCVCVCTVDSEDAFGLVNSPGSRRDITNLDQRSWVMSRDVGLGQSHVTAQVVNCIFQWMSSLFVETFVESLAGPLRPLGT